MKGKLKNNVKGLWSIQVGVVVQKNRIYTSWCLKVGNGVIGQVSAVDGKIRKGGTMKINVTCQERAIWSLPFVCLGEKRNGCVSDW